MNIYEYPLENILFLDIETVPQCDSYHKLNDDFKKLWDKKASFLTKGDEDYDVEEVYKRAGIYAEFGQIVCISVGNIYFTDNKMHFKLKSFFGENEKELLLQFADMLNQFNKKKNVFLAAHNGKEFDFPYIARRMVIQGILLPNVLQVAGKKPWEVTFIDTLELWKFGDYKNYTSLDLLTTVLNIPSPKDDIDGSMVGDIYHKEKDVERITRYCEKDVIAIAQLFLRYRCEPLIDNVHISSVTFPS